MRAVEERLRLISGLRSMERLDTAFRDELIEAENRAEEEGALGGLMPLTNEGFWRTMEREEQYALVLDSTSSVLKLTSNLLQLKDDKGNLVGEWLPTHRAEELREDEKAQFISDDFVLYRDIPFGGETKVVLPEVEFPFLYGTEGVANATSASPSGLADEIIRSRQNLMVPGLLSHLVGFDIVLGSDAEMRPAGRVLPRRRI